MNDCMAGGSKVFYAKLESSLSVKLEDEKSQVTIWIRTKINFPLIQDMILCLYNLLKTIAI